MENTNNEKIVKSSIHYYCLNGLYRTMASLSLEGQRMYPGDQTYRFYSGCSLAFEGRVQEAIRELERCTNDRDLAMGAILALIYSHNKCQIIDKDAVEALQKRLEDVKSKSHEITLYFGSLFLLLSKNFSEAQKYINQLTKTYPNYLDGKVLQGWLIVHYTDNPNTVDLLKKFTDVFSKINEPDVLIILAKVHEKLDNYNGSIEKLNQAIALYPRFLPALIEKIKIHALLKEFELLMDTAFRALVLDKHCIEPQRYLIIYYLAWDFNEESALSKIQDLIHSLELREPKNAHLYYESSRLISRLAFKSEPILLHSSSLIERSVFLDPTNVDYICEFALQCALLKRFQESQRHYKNASKLNPANTKPIIGSLVTKLMELDSMDLNSNKNVVDNFKLQLEKTCEEIDHLVEFNKTTTGLSSDLFYLCIKSYFLRKKSYSSIENYLSKIFDYYNELKNKNLSVEFYSNLEVYQLSNIVEICLSLSSPEPLVNGQQVPIILHYAKEFIGLLANVLPNHKEILYLSAMIKYLTCEIPSALNLVNRCLQYDSKFIQVFILMAKISIYDRNFKTAHQCLENALVLDFQIRNNISYILAKSSILKFEKKYDEALELLKDALDLDQKQHYHNIQANDKLFINLQIVDIYLMLNNTNEAKKVIPKLMEEFHEETLRGRIYLSQARIHCSIGDYESALQTLRGIVTDVGTDHFIRSRQMMAAIYLSKYKDRKRFTDCYKEVMEHFPSQQAQLMLGDAYMHILEPEMAIEIYEQALKKNPKDYSLVRKVGQALIKAHFYERAVTYYKAAIKSSGQSLSFCYDLAHLLCRLQRNEPAKEVINSALKSFNPKIETNLDVYIIKIKLLHLLAKVHLQSTEKEQAVKILKNAHVDNQKLMRRLPVEHPDLLDEHRKFSINLCKELAELLSTYNGDNQQALQIYKDSLAFDNKNNDIYLAMAKIELQNENFDLAHGYCTTILKNSANMEDAILMMADITFRQGDFEGALNLYSELLNKNITYFNAMMRFIEAARRFGKLGTVPSKLSQAEKYFKTKNMKTNAINNGNNGDDDDDDDNNNDTMTNTSTSISDSNAAGFYFCKGLYEWYTGNNNEAIKYLSMIRNDGQFGKQATKLIIEICIHPDYQTPSTISDSPSPYAEPRSSAQNSALKTAEALIQSLQGQNSDDFEVRLLNNLVLLARKQKTDAEFVLTDLMKYFSNERYNEHAGIIYGLAMAYQTLKQTPKARNQLKRIAKFPWKYTEAEYLEKSWLMLADIHIQSNKFDNANELLKRILRYNRSCSKAYEYCGFIMEKEQCYRDAATNYEQAWTYSNMNNPAIGYKLAFNYMKAKRFAEAIDICQTVLQRYPEYPKIKKDILDKCLGCLKS